MFNHFLLYIIDILSCSFNSYIIETTASKFLNENYTFYANYYIFYIYLMLSMYVVESLFLHFRREFYRIAVIMIRDGLN